MYYDIQQSTRVLVIEEVITVLATRKSQIRTFYIVKTDHMKVCEGGFGHAKVRKSARFISSKETT